MRRIRLSVSWLLLLVSLATVLAPALSWDAVAGELAHGDCLEASGDATPWDDHHRKPSSDGKTDHTHDECVGHHFSHLAALAAIGAGASLIQGSTPASTGRFPHWLPRITAIPEHPPKLRLSA